MTATLTAPGHQPDEDRFRVIRPEDVPWKPFPAFPSAARLAVLVGDPTKPGPYVIRVRLPAEVKMMPHRHLEDRIYTVISGVFYVGVGDVFDESKLNSACARRLDRVASRHRTFPLGSIRRIHYAGHRNRASRPRSTSTLQMIRENQHWVNQSSFASKGVRSIGSRRLSHRLMRGSSQR